MRGLLLSIFLTAFCLTSLAQTHGDIGTLFAGLSGQSENITKDSSVIKLIDKGEYLLPTLSTYFTDNTRSNVYSKCRGRFLKRGELAIILADRIEGMPYYTLTGYENCIVTYCDNNPNRVEYYLDWIRSGIGIKVFQKRYDEWLVSSDRKKYRK